MKSIAAYKVKIIKKAPSGRTALFYSCIKGF